MRFPPFDDEEPPLDYADNISRRRAARGHSSRAAAWARTTPTSRMCYDWLYDHAAAQVGAKFGVQRLRRTASWNLCRCLSDGKSAIASATSCSRTSVDRQLLLPLRLDKSFFTAKALNVGHTGRSQVRAARTKTSNPTTRKTGTSSTTYTEANNKHAPISTEYRIAFPLLLQLAPALGAGRTYHWYHVPNVVYIKTDDPDLPAFYYDPLVNPISRRHAVKHTNGVNKRNRANLRPCIDDDAELSAARLA
jgi:pre-mRNA-processing factor 8